jgi:thioredoxin 2
MAAGLIRCEHCGRANRFPAAAAGSLRCGSCHRPLPWVADADDDTFAEIADAATVPVLVDLGHRGARPAASSAPRWSVWPVT